MRVPIASLGPHMDGQRVRICGRVQRVRHKRKIAFVVVRDGSFDDVQLTIKDPELLKLAEKLDRGYVICAEGIVKASKIAKKGYEMIPEKIEVLSKSEVPPFDPFVDVDHTILAKRLDRRVLDLRNPRNRAILVLKGLVTRYMREYLYSQGFIEVHTPKVTITATEGGAEVFPVKRFDREAYLVMSPQLYKQMVMATGIERFLEVGPCRRAEKHHTKKHLNEYFGLDIEMAFATDEDAMKLLEDSIRYAAEKIFEDHERVWRVLNEKFEPPEKFDRITYDEAREILKKKGFEIPRGEDFGADEERALWNEINKPFFITKRPRSARPFYVMRLDEDPKYTKGFDLIYRVELASGAQREHRYEKLVENIKDKGLPLESFRYYLEAFRYGMPPHAGRGLGLERLMMGLFGIDEVRECVLFPRTVDRLTP